MYIWRNGVILKEEKAKISSKTHALHYSTCVIEGTAAYQTKNGFIIFRLADHLNRLINGAKTIGLNPTFNLEELKEATVKLLRLLPRDRNIYLRHFCYNSSTELGVGSTGETIVEITTRTLTPYLGETEGVALWYPAPHLEIQPCRFDPILSKIKWAGNYGRTFFFKKEASRYGCQEVIVEGPNSSISETAGSCFIFVDKDGNFLTPAEEALPLPSITLKTGIYLLEKLGIKVEKGYIFYEDLLSGRIKSAALFGTWTEIVQVEKIKIGIPPCQEIKLSPNSILKEIELLYKNMVRRRKIQVDFPEEWLIKV